MLELSPRIRKSSTATIIYRMMPVSQKGLKERLGMHKDAIWRAIKLLREHKLIYITGYESDNHTTPNVCSRKSTRRSETHGKRTSKCTFKPIQGAIH